ncbi:MAG: CPBP family intramembrane metalloprotease [Coriobacteriia bacterium]|nr:CPBP family intramembrane metalloprotease [Coriobacteriia bacterium]
MLPGLLFIGINAFGLNFDNFKIGIVLLGFVPGFVEEITFRGMIIPNFMRIYNRSKGIWLSLFVSAGIFGLIHLANIFAGADFGTT